MKLETTHDKIEDLRRGLRELSSDVEKQSIGNEQKLTKIIEQIDRIFQANDENMSFAFGKVNHQFLDVFTRLEKIEKKLGMEE